jgi:hypothetical protein
MVRAFLYVSGLLERRAPTIGGNSDGKSALFGRLYKTKASAGLYKKKPYELKPLESPK